ncbi:Glutamate synthase [NADPH] large chain [hydrothermal vent metagenome]|uniref:Glutamate synthase [NADPH] large chain n=1 Tax=hydrothermal vent metagenome TaxID=652676 RepID=A0A3B0XY69_9ZZZZ
MSAFAKWIFYSLFGTMTVVLLITLISQSYSGNDQRVLVKKSPRTVKAVTSHYSVAVDQRLKPWFDKAQVQYPPQKISLLAFKKEQRLELWAMQSSAWVLIRQYNFTASSGVLGPKLKEGDKQIPEGLYKISGLNPNSSYHLSMKINYPNDFDLRYALKEGRQNPGSNIFIHGRNKSIGCIALGDVAIEELFVLVATIGQKDVPVIVAPWDFRKKKLNTLVIPVNVRKKWLKGLYKTIDSKLKAYPLTAATPTG